MNKIKKIIIRVGAFAVAFIPTQIAASNNRVMAAYSNADISSVTSGIDILTDIVLAIVGGIGVIFLALGVLDFATAVTAHDTTQQLSGIKKAVAGIVVIAVPVIVKLLS